MAQLPSARIFDFAGLRNAKLDLIPFQFPILMASLGYSAAIQPNMDAFLSDQYTNTRVFFS